MEEVGAALRPLVMQTSDFLTSRVVVLSDFLREVVAVLLQAVSGIQFGVLRAVRDTGEVANTKVNPSRPTTGSVGRLYFVFTHEVDFPSSLRVVVNGSNLLQVLTRDLGASLVFNEDIVPVSRVVFVVWPL